MVVKGPLREKLSGEKGDVGVEQRFVTQSSLDFEKIGNLIPRSCTVSSHERLSHERRDFVRGPLSSTGLLKGSKSQLVFTLGVDVGVVKQHFHHVNSVPTNGCKQWCSAKYVLGIRVTSGLQNALHQNGVASRSCPV